ncbi:MAG: hypothetical protein DDT33_01722 [Firmicutes bacterium]|nr:hypothetical protein [Bacillota bacterium]
MLIMGLAIIYLGQVESSLTRRAILEGQALQLAEAGVERTIWKLRQHTNWTLEPPTNLWTNEPLGAGTYSVVLGPRSLHRVTVTSTGRVRDKKRAVQVDLSRRGNVVGFWKFDEGDGDRAYDSTRNKNHGDIVNDADWTTGREGFALSFDDGDEQHVIVPSSLSLNLAHEITLDHWFQTALPPQMSRFMVVKGEPYRYGTYLTDFSRTLSFYVRLRNSGVRFVSYTRGGIGFADGNWHRVTGTFDGRFLRLYHNGTLRGTTDIGAQDTITFDNNPLYFARWGNDYFRGVLDEIRITDRALVPEEF